MSTLAGSEPEDGDITFLRKVSKLLPDYIVKRP
jgi:hypothetical protein